MTHHTDAEQERASLGAFIDRAGRDGFDTAHTFFDCGGVVFFNPDTADLWGFWQAARRAPAAPVPQGLREAAQAVVERWDTPLWKDVPATAVYIADLRAALAAATHPPEAAPVQLPEPSGVVVTTIGNYASVNAAPFVRKGDKFYTEQQVRQLLANHGIQEQST